MLALNQTSIVHWRYLGYQNLNYNILIEKYIKYAADSRIAFSIKFGIFANNKPWSASVMADKPFKLVIFAIFSIYPWLMLSWVHPDNWPQSRQFLVELVNITSSWALAKGSILKPYTPKLG